MNAAAWGFIGTLVGAFVGTAGTLAATWMQQKHASKREREASEREQALQRRTFQRDVLLELQETLASLLRAYGQADHHDETEWRKSGEWGRSLLPDDVSESMRAIGVRAVLLAERVDSEDVRQSVRDLNDLLASKSLTHDRDEAQTMMLQAAADVTALQRTIGETFRAL